MPSHRMLLLVGIAAVALASGLWFGGGLRAPAALRAVTALPAPRALPPFALASGTATLNRDDLAGRWTVVFFGFSHCPDVCPTTLALLANVARAIQDLEPAQQPRVLFVSVDPARDTPARLAEFTRFFGPSFVGATADDATLATLTGALGAPFTRGAADAAGEYDVDHSGALFLLDPAVRFAAVMTPPLDGPALAADLRTLIGGTR